MTATDPLAEILRHQYDPGDGDEQDGRGSCGCGDRVWYTAKGHNLHLAAVVQPAVEAREREVMASVAGEILDVVHTMAAALAQCPDPYREAGKAALLFERGARARFGSDTPSLRTAGYQLACDAPHCRARVEASMINLSRQKAAAQGWDVAVPGRGRVTDLCPEHRRPAAAAVTS